jgi:aminoglycoside phosphotransferase (APT) family kinase protein
VHAAEVDTSVDLVRRLVSEQFPHWSSLAIAPVASLGTDHALFRLGDDLVARLPRVRRDHDQYEKERAWLPRLAPLLPVPLPQPLARGEPGAGYPFAWSVYRWLEGRVPAEGAGAPMARDLSRFVAALRAADAAGGPAAGEQNFYRGAPLAQRDEPVRAALSELDGMVDTDAAEAAWERALAAAPWEGRPVWVHGDLTPENLLERDGRLAAVIDWGCLGVGDPACDVMVAWSLLSADSRRAFRGALRVDDATWARGSGWALSTALIALPYYAETHPSRAANARYRIDQVLREQEAVRRR